MTRVCRHCATKTLLLVIASGFCKNGVAIYEFNANLPLDCHEFARLRSVNSRNDENSLSY